MSTRDWRRDADYDPVDQFDIADYAWEFLRRNPLYQSDYAAVQSDDGGQHTPGRGGGLSPHWGLRFPGRSGAAGDHRAGVLAA
jgi:hypothetical protein